MNGTVLSRWWEPSFQLRLLHPPKNERILQMEILGFFGDEPNLGPLSHPSFWGPKKPLSFSLGCSFRLKVPTRKFGDEPERLDTIQLLFFWSSRWVFSIKGFGSRFPRSWFQSGCRISPPKNGAEKPLVKFLLSKSFRTWWKFSSSWLLVAQFSTVLCIRFADSAQQQKPDIFFGEVATTSCIACDAGPGPGHPQFDNGEHPCICP